MELFFVFSSIILTCAAYKEVTQGAPNILTITTPEVVRRVSNGYGAVTPTPTPLAAKILTITTPEVVRLIVPGYGANTPLPGAPDILTITTPEVVREHGGNYGATSLPGAHILIQTTPEVVRVASQIYGKVSSPMPKAPNILTITTPEVVREGDEEKVTFAPPDLQTTEEPARQVVITGKILQNPGNVVVCWETSGWEQEKKLVQQAVTRTWQRYSGLRFTHWGDCQAVQDADVRIQVGEFHPRVEAFGSDLKNLENGMKLNFEFNEWPPIGDGRGQCQRDRFWCLEHLAVHEFGHAIGLVHEQNHKDVPESCRQNLIDRGYNTRDHFGGDEVTIYDASSVMNYCNEHWHNAGQLSKADIEGVRKIYGPAPGCADSSPMLCPLWARKGECEKNPFFMLPECQKSCDSCGTTIDDVHRPFTSAGCNNTDELCQFFKEMGECKKNPAFMHPNCQLSCGTGNCFIGLPPSPPPPPTDLVPPPPTDYVPPPPTDPVPPPTDYVPPPPTDPVPPPTDYVPPPPTDPVPPPTDYVPPPPTDPVPPPTDYVPPPPTDPVPPPTDYVPPPPTDPVPPPTDYVPPPPTDPVPPPTVPKPSPVPYHH